MGNSEQGHGPSKVETKAARVSASAPPTLDHLRGKPEDFVALADAELVFDGTVLSVHRAILANASAWFRSLFSALQEEVAIGSDITFSREQFEDVSLADFCSFLRCLYTPTAKVVREELIKVQREAGKVLLDVRLEPLLQLSHFFDAPGVFSLVEQAVAKDPTCRLSQLMDPLRWLLACDAYSHLGYLANTRATCISFLTAKFTSMQSDPRLDRLSSPTLTEVVRMAGFRLASLSTSCGHVHAVQDRAVQRFVASAQQVAAEQLPAGEGPPTHPLVTRWWHSPSTHCITLSWAPLDLGEVEAGGEGPMAVEGVDRGFHPRELQLPVVVPQEEPALGAAAAAGAQQAQHGVAAAEMPAELAQHAQQGVAGGDWAQQTLELHRLLSQVSASQQAKRGEGGEPWEKEMLEGVEATTHELEELLQALEAYGPEWEVPAQQADQAQQAADDHAGPAGTATSASSSAASAVPLTPSPPPTDPAATDSGVLDALPAAPTALLQGQGTGRPHRLVRRWGVPRVRPY